MGSERNPQKPFVLTPLEEKVISLKLAGKTSKDIIAELGVTGLISVAVEKDRLRRLSDPRRNRGDTSLSVARGNVRMEGTK